MPSLSAPSMNMPAARPKTTRSSSELPPRRLAPWTDTQAASPQANRPLTIWSLPSASCMIAWPCTLVGIPPIM